VGKRDAGARDVDEAIAQHQALIELLSDAVVLLENEGRRVVAANTAAAHLLGYSRAALTMMTLDDLCDATEVPRLDTAFLALTTVSAARGVWRIRQASGEIVPVEVVATRCLLGERALVQIVARDLSAPVRLESARSFAATASSRLAASLEYEETVRAAVELAVPGLADTCTLDVLDEAGRWCRAAVATHDPAKGGLPTIEVVPAAARAEPDVEQERASDEQVLTIDLQAHGRPVGRLTLRRNADRVWHPDARLLAGELARRVALALDSALLWRTAQRELSRRAALLRIVRAFADSAPGSDRVMEVLLNEALVMLGADHGGIALWDAPSGTLIQIFSNTGRSNGLEVNLEASLSGRAAADRRPAISNAYQEEFGRVTPGGRYGALAGIAAPLLHEGRLLGVISVGTTEPSRAFKEVDADALELLAGVAASMLGTLERAQLHAVSLAARELGHRLNNDLALAVGTIDMLRDEPSLSEELGQLVTEAAEGLGRIADQLRQLQRLVRFQIRETPVGPALDLERSTGPDAPLD
jgi:PAS domain S-box-containing protein